ncbi:uncharacterized protein [Amphiura filiformis]|uniref:uncharacterized protein n=1 Tax=Amphiura filiformis TaxID=82378 RepID=UPI003B20CDE7
MMISLLRFSKDTNVELEEFLHSQMLSFIMTMNSLKDTLKHFKYIFILTNLKLQTPLRNRGEYKLGGFYFLLGNLEPKYRSKQHIVQLACLCKVTDLKHYGLEVILARLISDLKTLETDGIEFYHDGRKFHFHGTLALVVGDNLAQHFMGGFPENFSTSLRLCRFCTGTNELVKTSLREDDFTWRNQEGYNEQAHTVEVHPHLSSVYGVKRRSPLNQLENFHVVCSLPSDIAHDLFEGGVVSVRLAIIVCSLVQDRHFSLKLLNERIEQFEYASCDRSNPIPPMPEQIAQFKIKSTIAETWLLMRMLPLLIGDKVPEGNDVWELYLKLADMVECICAKSYECGEIEYMGEKIVEFHESFHEVLRILYGQRTTLLYIT